MNPITGTKADKENQENLWQRAAERGLDLIGLINVERLEAALTRDPENGLTHLGLGRIWHSVGEYRRALGYYDAAVRLSPGLGPALLARASLLATCPDAAVRDGATALKDALAATESARAAGDLSTEWQHRMYVRTLSAAYAELGDFETALQVQRRALEFTITRTGLREVNLLLAHLESRQPIRLRNGLAHRGPIGELRATSA